MPATAVSLFQPPSLIVPPPTASWQTLRIPETVQSRALVKEFFFFNQKVSIFSLFLDENICCGYSLEGPRRGTSNEYPQCMFSSRNKKNIYMIPPLIKTYDRGNRNSVNQVNFACCCNCPKCLHLVLPYITYPISRQVHLTLVLLTLDIPCLCKQCRSRSVGF